MNRVGVPRTSPDASPLSTSRRTRPSDRRAGPVAVEPRDVELELGGIPPQVVVLERLLAMEEQLVHLPEPVLERGRLGRGGRGERVRVDLGQRKVPEREAHTLAQSSLDPFDLPKRPARVGAFVVAVLDDQRARPTRRGRDRPPRRVAPWLACVSRPPSCAEQTVDLVILFSPLRSVTPVPELVDESGVGRLPAELGASPGRVGALIEQKHLGEVVAQARPGLVVGARNRARSAGRDSGRLGYLGHGRIRPSPTM